MQFNVLHPWPDSFHKARELQISLQKKIAFNPLDETPKIIAGADIAYSKEDNLCFAAVAVFNLAEARVIEEKFYSEPVHFPYVPGYLSFRELPALIKVFRLVENVPDLVFVDGHGHAHPRRFGLASHLGLWLQKPTIGVAKKKLVGHYEEPLGDPGNYSYLIYQEQIIGAVLRSRKNTKPVFISTGHLIDLSGAIQLTVQVCDGFKIPYPTRIADKIVGRYKKDCLKNG